MNCRHCDALLRHTFLDLGFAPPSNAYLTVSELNRPETYFPLKVRVCEMCWLVQTEDYATAQELFRSDYAYFSSTSVSWLKHAEQYVRDITQRLCLDAEKFVIEIASNDGYLLKNFVAARIPCLGIEPTYGTAVAAEAQGIPVLREFFTEGLARRLVQNGQQADLIVANNVFAHVPDINGFTRGLAAALKPNGTLTLEFPHLLRLIEGTQFDTIYHEHFSYLSLHAVERIFDAAQLRIYDVEELPTHGGSLRIYGCHKSADFARAERVDNMVREEIEGGLLSMATYQGFQKNADRIKNDLLLFLLEQKQAGRTVVGYGAAAKGNTLLNYAGVRQDLLPFVCDAAKSKQGKFLPGTHLPIIAPSALADIRPDYLLILPWNISDEVIAQNRGLAKDGCRFVVAVPQLRVL